MKTSQPFSLLRRLALSLAAAVFSLAFSPGNARSGTIQNQDWFSMNAGMPGTNETASKVIEKNGIIYAIGSFSFIDSTPAQSVAKWDGTAWAPIGEGFCTDWAFDPWDEAALTSIAVDDSGNVYVGGIFTQTASGTPMTNLAKWNGSSWTSFGNPNGLVRSIGFDASGNLIVTGNFTSIGGVAANRIAKWDGSSWSALGTGFNGIVHAVKRVPSSTDLIAAGEFTTAGGAACATIARWNGSAWTTVGSGVGAKRSTSTGTIYSMDFDSSGNLIIGGIFDTVDGVAVGSGGEGNVAKWNGSNWVAMKTGLNGSVSSVRCDASGNIYLGGTFSQANASIAANNLIRYNNASSSWFTVGTGTNANVTDMTFDASGNLWLAGLFTHAGGTLVGGITKWDGTSFLAFGSGINGKINATVKKDGILYIGGSFSMAGQTPAKNVASWDGSSWSALGDGTDGEVTALTFDASGKLCIGGHFATAGSATVNGVARWTGSAWEGIGSGWSGIMGNRVFTLVSDASGTLYAGGTFQISRWDGSTWVVFGPSSVYSIVFDASGNLYAGGGFSSINSNTSLARLAKWDGSAWSSLGTKPGGDVRALAFDASGNLFASGFFTTIGGISASRIAKWNGSSWSALGSGPNSGAYAYALLADGSGNVYAAGTFTSMGGVSANRIAQWNGSAWSALGSGLNSDCFSLNSDDYGNLYAGGIFTSAGGKISPFFAKASPPQTISIVRSSHAVEGVSAGSFTVRSTSSFPSDTTILFSVGGSASPGSDYTSFGSSVVLPAGATSVAIPVSITDDSSQESTETISVTLSPSASYTLAPKPYTSASLTITDDDGPGTIGFSSPSYSFSEGSGTVSIPVHRTEGRSGAVSANYTITHSSTASSDFSATMSGTLSWADSDSSDKQIEIQISQDTAIEGSESFSIVLSDFSGGAAQGTTSSSVTISDDECDWIVTTLADDATTPPPGSLRQAIASAALAGGNQKIGFRDGVAGTITVAAGPLATLFPSMPTSITIDGRGLVEINGNAKRLFYVSSASAPLTLAFENLTIRNAFNNTGAIVESINSGNLLTIKATRSVFRENNASVNGSLFYLNGTRHSLEMTDCSIYGNRVDTTQESTTLQGAIIYLKGLNMGGETSSVTLDGCTFNDNVVSATGSPSTAKTLAGVLAYNKSGTSDIATITARNSTFSGNSVTANNAIYTINGGVLYSTLQGGQIDFFNCTLAGNSCTNSADASKGKAGAIFVSSGSVLRAFNSIFANSASDSLTANFSFGSGTPTLSNCLVYWTSGLDASGVSDGSNNSKIGTGYNPGLLALANNGGFTQTRAIPKGSPAENAGDNSFVSGGSYPTLSTDQRGSGFPRKNGTVDIGSFEYQAPEIQVSRPGQTIANNATDSVSATSPSDPKILSYTIQNTGSISLSLGSISFSSPTNCSVSADASPASSIAASASDSLVLRVTPSSSGAWSFSVSIPTNDDDENPFAWTVSGTAAAPAPEVRVSKNGTTVADGSTDVLPSAPAGQVSLSYSVENSGNQPLTLGTPAISSQSNCSVAIAASPSSSVAADSSSALQLTVTPAASGPWSFSVSLETNDSDENPYSWTVAGAVADRLVSSLSDSGAGSLRQAVTDAIAAGGNQSIGFSDGLSGKITVASTIAIAPSTGRNLNLTLLSNGGITLSGGTSKQILTVDASNDPVSLQLFGITFEDGFIGTGGGAIKCFTTASANSITLNATRCVFQNNRVSGTGGGAVYFATVQHTASFKDCSFTNNRAEISTATAIYGGAIYAKGVNLSGRPSSISLDSCLFDQNLVSSTGTPTAAVKVAGGAFAFVKAGTNDVLSLVATNCTFSGNSATGGNGTWQDVRGGALYLDTAATSTQKYYHCTMASNSATNSATASKGNGGALYLTSGGSATAYNCLFAGNTASDDATNNIGKLTTTFAAYSSLFYLASGADGSGITDGTNACKVGASYNPLLATLGSNGGPTKTHALQSGSPAIDAASSTYISGGSHPSVSFDQRGSGFLRSFGTAPDAGAYESQNDFAPEIAVSRSGAIADGGSDSLSGLIAGIPQTVSYSITNSGSAALTLDSASVSSTSNCSVSVSSQPSSPVAVGASPSTLSLSITPTAAGAWGASVSLPNGDSDENPYNWTISGTASAPNFGILALSSASYSIAENGGSLTVSVARTVGTDGSVSVNYSTANGTASSPSDFASASGTLSWASGESGTKSFSVSISDDSTYEGDESFSVSLSDVSGGATLGVSSASVTISEDDPMPDYGTLSLAASSYSVSENGGSVTVSVERSRISAGDISVNFATSAGTASAPSDFTPSSGTLSWPAHDMTPKTIVVSIQDDALYEGNEFFVVSLSSPSIGASLGTSQAQVTVTDNESPSGTEIDIQGSGTSITNGDSTPSSFDSTDFGSSPVGGAPTSRSFSILNAGTGTLTLTGSPKVTVSGTHASDFSVASQPSSATLDAGQSTTFQVSFSPSDSGVRSAVLTIQNSDSDEGSYSFSIQGIGSKPGFSVYAWNTFDQLNLAPTRAAIVDLRPDVILLMEVSSSADVDTLASELQAATGFTYQKYYPPQSNVGYPLAFLSRFPMSDCENLSLNTAVDKSVPKAAITVDGELFYIVGLHARTASVFSSHADEADLLLSQIAAATSHTRTIVIGDFNSRAASDGGVTDPASLIYGSDTFDYPAAYSIARFLSAGYIDSWRSIHPTRSPLATKMLKNDEASGSNSNERIDYALVSPDLQILDAGIHSETTNNLSDHKPIWVRIGTQSGTTRTQGAASKDSGPQIISSTLAPDNSYLDLTFDRGVYANANATGSLVKENFYAQFNKQSNGAANSIYLSSVTHTPGDSTARLNFTVSGTPNGKETFVVYLSTYDEVVKRHVYSASGTPDTWARMKNGSPWASTQRTLRHHLNPSGTSPLTVTTGTDTVAGSLRNAIAKAAWGDTITIDPSVTSISLNSEIAIDKDLTIAGHGISSISITTPNNNRLFSIVAPGLAKVVFRDLALTGGTASTPDSSAYGGAIYNEESLVLERVAITSCTARGDSSPTLAKIGYGGAIYSKSNSSLRLYRCLLSNNTATGTSESGKVAYGCGGAIAADGALSIEESTLSSNTATSDLGTDGRGGAIYLTGTASVDASTLNGNSSIAGGAAYTTGSMTLKNSTLSGNGNTTTQGNGGAIYCSTIGSLRLYNSTLYGNASKSTSQAGAIYLQGISSSARIYSTIVASNTGASAAPSLYGTFEVVDHSLLDNTTGAILLADTFNQKTAATGISPTLANNGGQTWTHALLEGSNAINCGANPSALLSDQRGTGSSRTHGIAPDIGAYESAFTAAPFPAWIVVEGLSGSGAALSADPDNDGITNFLEYALGLSPSAHDALGLPSITQDGSSLSLTFRKNRVASGLTYTVQSSTDLSAWTDETTATENATLLDDSDPDARIFKALVPSAPRLFLRLKITAP